MSQAQTSDGTFVPFCLSLGHYLSLPSTCQCADFPLETFLLTPPWPLPPCFLSFSASLWQKPSMVSLTVSPTVLYCKNHQGLLECRCQGSSPEVYQGVDLSSPNFKMSIFTRHVWKCHLKISRASLWREAALHPSGSANVWLCLLSSFLCVLANAITASLYAPLSFFMSSKSSLSNWGSKYI